MVLESLCNFFRLVISFTLSSSLVILSSVPWILLSQSFVLSILIIVFLVLKFLYSSSYIFFLFVKFIYLLKLFFSFVSSTFTFLQSRIFTITVLKSLLENSNLCHLGVGINQVYCFIPFEVFSLILVWCVTFFLLQPGHLGYSVMRFQILCEASVLVDFLWCCSTRENENVLRPAPPSLPTGLHWQLSGGDRWMRMRVLVSRWFW